MFTNELIFVIKEVKKKQSDSAKTTPKSDRTALNSSFNHEANGHTDCKYTFNFTGKTKDFVYLF